MTDELLFKSIKSERVYEIIISQILNLIKTGELKPNDRLPSERKMAELLSCSRSSLREAFRVLESDGLIISKAGGGRYVQNIKQKEIDIGLNYNSVDLIQESAILYFLEVREIIEPKIVELAIDRGTDEEFLRLEEIIIKMKEKFKHPDSNISTDSEFHIALAEMTGNFVFVSILKSNLTMIRKIRSKSLSTDKRYNQAINEHLNIFKSIKEKNKNDAIKFTLEHINNLKMNIKNDMRIKE